MALPARYKTHTLGVVSIGARLVLDCSSIVPRLFLDCSSIVPRLFLDCSSIVPRLFLDCSSIVGLVPVTLNLECAVPRQGQTCRGRSLLREFAGHNKSEQSAMFDFR